MVQKQFTDDGTVQGVDVGKGPKTCAGNGKMFDNIYTVFPEIEPGFINNALSIFQSGKSFENLIPAEPSNGKHGDQNDKNNQSGIAFAYFPVHQKKGEEQKRQAGADHGASGKADKYGGND